MFRTLKAPLKELLQTWQISDWPFTLVFGLMMDGKLVCEVFFVCLSVYLCSSVRIFFILFSSNRNSLNFVTEEMKNPAR